MSTRLAHFVLAAAFAATALGDATAYARHVPHDAYDYDSVHDRHGRHGRHDHRPRHRPHWRRTSVRYECLPCHRHFRCRDDLHRHVLHRHRVPPWRLPFVVVRTAFGWIFYG